MLKILFFYYVGNFVIRLAEGTTPAEHFFSKKLFFYGNLSFFIVLPICLLFIICILCRELLSSTKNKKLVAKINYIYGLIIICLFVLSIFFFFMDALGFGRLSLLFGISYLIFLTFILALMIFMYRVFSKKIRGT